MTKREPAWRRSAMRTLHAALMLKASIEERLLAETGLLLADSEALSSLARAERAPRMSEVAGALGLTRGGTTKVVDRLQALGYVERSADPADGRAVVVTLTDAGQGAMLRAGPIVDEALRDLWGRHLTAEDSEALSRAIDKVLAGNEGWLGPGAS